MHGPLNVKFNNGYFRFIGMEIYVVVLLTLIWNWVCYSIQNVIFPNVIFNIDAL